MTGKTSIGIGAGPRTIGPATNTTGERTTTCHPERGRRRASRTWGGWLPHLRLVTRFAPGVFWVCPGCASGQAERSEATPSPVMQQPAASTSRPESKVDEPVEPSTVEGCAALRATGDHPLIDDFELGGMQLPLFEGRAGQWFVYDDMTGGRMTADVEVDDSAALHVTSQAFSGWGSGLGVTLSSSSNIARLCPYDASVFDGLQFRAKGHGRVKLRISMPVNTPLTEGGQCTKAGEECYDWPGYRFNLDPAWQTLDVPFCQLLPEYWFGDADEFDPTQLGAIHFQLEGDAEFWLDDLQFTQAGADSDGTCRPRCPLDGAGPTALVAPDETWVTLTESLTVNTFEQPTSRCGTLVRRYLSYVPAELPDASDAPVLIALHGSSANAESFHDDMARGRLDELAERDGFVVVYGNAAPGQHTDPELIHSGAWRQSNYDDGEVDDVEYLRLIIEDLKRRDIIDGNNAVYLTGISNGGGMVLEAAKRYPDRFAGIAPFMAWDGFEPTKVPDLSGTGLTRILFAYSPNDPGMPDGYVDVLSQLPAQWGQALGMSDAVLTSPVEVALDDRVVEGDGYDGDNPVRLATVDSRATRFDYADPTRDVHLRVLVFANAGHLWPNPVQDSRDWMLDRWGFRNQDVDASDAVWDFFMGR